MPTADEYKENIRECGWKDLEDLWEQISDHCTLGWENGKALEYLVLRCFELDDEKVVVTYPYENREQEKNDVLEQIDGVVFLDGKAFLIECKHQKKTKTKIDAIAKLHFRLQRRPTGTLGSFFSTSGYTRNTVLYLTYVSPQNILLWDKTEIEYALKNKCMVKGLKTKFMNCVIYSLPNSDFTELF